MSARKDTYLTSSSIGHGREIETLSRPRSVLRLASPLLLVLLALLMLGAAPASAAAPAWRLDSLASSHAAPGSQLTFYNATVNVGTADTSGEFDWTAALPAGMTAVSVSARNFTSFTRPTCTAGDGISPVAGATTVLCKDTHAVGFTSLGKAPIFILEVAVDPGTPDPSTLTVAFQVSGGGAATARFDDPTRITAAAPGFGINSFDGQVSADPAGNPQSQAAATPYAASTTIDFNTVSSANPLSPNANPVEPTKDVSVDLPPGLVGIPAGLPQCTAAQLANLFSAFSAALCPAASEVGTTMLQELSLSIRPPFPAFPPFVGPIPVYNMVPPPGVPARFGFNFAGVIVVLDAKLRSGSDYGLSVVSRNIGQAIPLAGASFTFWGVPADPSHDRDRACPGQLAPWQSGPSAADVVNCVDANNQPLYTRPPLTSFLRDPTSCTGPLTTTAHIDSWFNPGATNADGTPDLADPNWKTASFVSHNPPGWPELPDQWGSPQGVTGCGLVPFDPTITVQPTSQAADSPTGLNVDLHLPQTQDPSQLAEADLRRAVVNLPAGMAVNPSAADGLGACSSAQIALHSDGPASCPDNAKVGTVSIDTPLLSDPLDGSIYLARQQDNPNNNLLTIYIVASGHGVNVKLPGRIDADPNTGQLKATFDNQPQLPFNDLHLSFFSGDRASLTTPPTCGTKAAQASFDSWSNPGLDVQRGDSFAITSGANGTPCPSDAAHRPFAPTMSAGTTNPAAGKFSPFVLRLTRQPGEQELTRLSADLPPGVLGKLAGISQCSDAALNSIPTGLGTGAAEAANPSCPANSQVGYARVGAGSGTPFYIPGKVYLAGPYNGAPLSVAIVTPALAGPFDLGNVVVRTALNIDKDDAQIHVQSDPIPTILQGIPLDIRDVRVVLDRSNFTLNPTNCTPMSVTGQVGGAGGVLASSADDTSAAVSDRFQVGGCGGLGFNPHLSTTLNGSRADTHRSSHPNLVFGLHANPGDANLASVAVTLPQAFQIDQANLGNICSETQLATNECAGRNTIGTASATTPLLDTPLSGPVYAVSGSGGLPKLAVILHGPPSMPIELVVRGITDTVGARIRNTFPLVPDAPITDFTLSINGGPGGYLVNNTNLCPSAKASKKKKRKIKTGQRSDVIFTGQNGDTLTSTVPLTAPCGKHKKHKRHARHTKH